MQAMKGRDQRLASLRYQRLQKQLSWRVKKAETIYREAMAWNGLDRDDLQSMANEVFVDSMRTHDPTRGSFDAHVLYKVQAAFNDLFRRIKYRSCVLPRVTNVDLIFTHKITNPEPEPLADYALTILFSDWLREECESLGFNHETDRDGVVFLIRDRLLQEGWDGSEIERAFNHLREGGYCPVETVSAERIPESGDYKSREIRRPLANR